MIVSLASAQGPGPERLSSISMRYVSVALRHSWHTGCNDKKQKSKVQGTCECMGNKVTVDGSAWRSLFKGLEA